MPRAAVLSPSLLVPISLSCHVWNIKNGITDVAVLHVLPENEWTLKGRVPSLRGDQYGAHICRSTQIEEHMDDCGTFYCRWVHRVYLCVCVDVARRGKTGERDGVSDSTAWKERGREKKPGDMKLTETNKSSPFAYCCMLMRSGVCFRWCVSWRGKTDMDEGGI